jgi:hypothetical protein
MGEILRDFFWRQQLTGLGRPELDVERVFRYRFSSRFSNPPVGLFDQAATGEYMADEIAAATRVANEGGNETPKPRSSTRCTSGRARGMSVVISGRATSP